MILLTIAASIIWASFFWQWIAPSADRPEALRGFPTVATGLCACIALLGYTPTWLDDRAAAKAARAASALVGEPVEFECGSRLGVFFDRHTDMARGYVRWTDKGPEKSSKLRFETCQGLRAFLNDLPSVALDDKEKVIAVHILTHEAMHMAGERNEAVAECKAIQRNVAMATHLGANAESAEALALMYAQMIYPLVSAAYRSEECRQGGKLDENLPGSPWNLQAR